MKVLYITTVNLMQESGVASKIRGQVKAMRKQGLDVQILYATNGTINYVNLDDDRVFAVYRKLPVVGFFNMLKALYSNAFKIVNEKNYDGVYIRYSLSDWNLIKFLKSLKRSGVKIFIEIASYPYDGEYKAKTFFKKLGLQIDKFYRKKLYKYVDCCFVPRKNIGSVFNMNTVLFDNGVSIKDINTRNYEGRKENTLRLLGVANLSPWHGYDRVIEGIYEYYKNGGKANVIFHVVGEGAELENLKSLVDKLDLGKNVVFYGKKFGGDLDKIYGFCDVGVAAIGIFRQGTDNTSSLKTKEYCAKSLPFIMLHQEAGVDEDFPYAYRIENTPEPVDISEIIKFFEGIEKENYIEYMREYAEENFDWEEKFKVVIDKIKSC